MASKIFAGADMYLMPSRFEPCGLSQMMAMRYGTVPIVHETGGLKDSVREYKDFDGVGDGFAFSDYQAKDLLLTIQEAVKLYFSNEEMFDKLQKRCMEKDFSWKKSAQAYQSMYSDICGSTGVGEYISFQDAFDQLKHCYLENAKQNKLRYPDKFHEGYHRVIQIEIVGRGSGFFYVEYQNGELSVIPEPRGNAEAFIECSFDNLLDMARGFVTTDKLFLAGHLKLSGNLAKGFEARYLLTPGR